MSCRVVKVNVVHAVGSKDLTVSLMHTIANFFGPVISRKIQTIYAGVDWSSCQPLANEDVQLSSHDAEVMRGPGAWHVAIRR